MKVHVPTHLRSYTGREAEVEAAGGTLGELLLDLDRRYRGIRFRMIDEQDAIRPHIKLFVNAEIVRDLATRLRPGDEVHIVAALSGG